MTNTAATPRPVQRLIDEFSRLPGIGPKSASRLTFFLLRAQAEHVTGLGEALLALKSETRFCSVCFNITAAERDPCVICLDDERDGGLLCVVEEPLDMLAIERAGLFRGRYHVLHGVISPVDGIGPDELRISELLRRVHAGQVTEVILATNPNLAGEATAMYLYQQLVANGLRITRLARGLPVGGDVEYADEVTLARALEGRSQM
ncbi:MAG: recombination mediator RecR [Anaerolineales bacterium]|nr:recombination mediator RecR [Anaerolineales bacterium]